MFVSSRFVSSSNSGWRRQPPDAATDADLTHLFDLGASFRLRLSGRAGQMKPPNNCYATQLDSLSWCRPALVVVVVGGGGRGGRRVSVVVVVQPTSQMEANIVT